MTTVDDEWESFLDGCDEIDNNTNICINNNVDFKPICSDLYISTKSKIYYLNQNIPLDIFWKIKITDYFSQSEGIIKKQIKYDSKDIENIDKLQELLKNEPYSTVQIIKHNTHNDTFKDIRKISVGLCNKDISNSRIKQKNAFFNCFVIIMRIYDDYNNKYKESHIKIFNTGKIEIPGIKSDYILNKTLQKLIELLSSITSKEISYKKENITILINSNFNCNYYIDRLNMFYLLKNEYGLETMYDPCIYPGIQCKFYYSSNRINNDGKTPKKNDNEINDDFIKMSFMIFRTGSILIVGKCEEYVLEYIYKFLKEIIINNYTKIIANNNNNIDINENKNKEKKIRKKYILLKN